MADDPADAPPWDDETAEALHGAYVLIGITTLHANGSLHSQLQMHGRIAEMARERGIAIALEGARAGEIYWLPPDLRGWQSAAPGEYRLRSTAEVVVDPDYTASWTITKPANT
jgi:hypothetical protein